MYFNSIVTSTNSAEERLNKFTWATFENHWDLLLRDWSETNNKIGRSINVQKNRYCPTTKQIDVLSLEKQEIGSSH